MKWFYEMVRNIEKLNQEGKCVQYKSETVLERICSVIGGNQFGFEMSAVLVQVS